MMQKSQVLTRENNRISVISAGGTTMQEDYLIIAERELPINISQRSWIFEGVEKARAGRTTPTLVNPLVRILRWVNHLGSGKIDDSCLESRHSIHHNFRINSIGR
jgi:hypothetical protein